MQGPPSSPEIIRHRSGAVAATTSEHPSSAVDLNSEQDLDLDTNLSSLYTTARRFPSPPPSLTPSRTPERKGAGGIVAGSRRRLLLALFSCSSEKGEEAARSLRTVEWRRPRGVEMEREVELLGAPIHLAEDGYAIYKSIWPN